MINNDWTSGKLWEQMLEIGFLFFDAEWNVTDYWTLNLLLQKIMFFNIFEILLIIIKIVICFHQHILECIINYIFVYTYWCIHILVWMLLQYICRLYTINEIVKPNDKPSNTNYVDLKMSIFFFIWHWTYKTLWNHSIAYTQFIKNRE